TAVTRRVRQAANFAELAGPGVDLADRRPARFVGKTLDPERNVFAITTRIEGCRGRTIRQRTQDALRGRDPSRPSLVSLGCEPDFHDGTSALGKNDVVFG